MFADNVAHNYAAQLEQTISTCSYFYDGIVSHIYIYDRKVSRIDRASVTIILCLHVLIARGILLILDMLIFSVNIDVIKTLI